MEDTFYTVAEDKGLSIILKREANIILASLDKDSNEAVKAKHYNLRKYTKLNK